MPAQTAALAQITQKRRDTRQIADEPPERCAIVDDDGFQTKRVATVIVPADIAGSRTLVPRRLQQIDFPLAVIAVRIGEVFATGAGQRLDFTPGFDDFLFSFAIAAARQYRVKARMRLKIHEWTHRFELLQVEPRRLVVAILVKAVHT